MKSKIARAVLAAIVTVSVLVALSPGVAGAAVLGQHHLTWWDDLQLGVIVTQQNAPMPTPTAIHLLDLDEWHLDMVDTRTWYGGGAVAGLPVNPFNPANRTGIIGTVTPVSNAEGFVYQIRNVNYFSGNGSPLGPPLSFTDPFPPGPGVNDLSGINIVDTHGALNIAAPATGSQFMFTSLINSQVLDMTPGAVFGAIHDWDFNAFSGTGNFEWDIQSENGAGVTSGLPPAVFGYAMPGNWLDGINDGWVHSWNASTSSVPPPTSIQVNLGTSVGGFSGPVPEPATTVLFVCGALGLVSACRRRL